MTLSPDIEDRYEILEPLGAGGMGAVYKVRDRRLNRILVAKTILLDTADLREREELRERFRREAELASRLDHPNIVRVHDVSSDGSWIVMEFVDGPTLRDLLDRGPLPIGLSLEIARQTLQALEYLHRQGSIHRDISPENLMLTRDSLGFSLVKLIDLGIARSTSERGPRLTMKGGFIGKPRYAAPEHLDDRGPLEPPSDIYSFGIVLYELLTGVHPFEGRTAALRPGAPRPEPLSFAVSDPQRRIPLELRSLVITAIAEDPQGRFRSAEALAAELAKIQAQLPLGETTHRSASAAPPLVSEETGRSPGMATAPSPAPTAPMRTARPTRLPHQTSSRSILPRLVVLAGVLTLLLSLWFLLTRRDEPEVASVTVQDPPAMTDTSPASSSGGGAVEPPAGPGVPAVLTETETGSPVPAEPVQEILPDRPEVRREPVPGPAEETREPSSSSKPARSKPEPAAPKPAAPKPDPPQDRSTRPAPRERRTERASGSRTERGSLSGGSEFFESESAVPLTAPTPRYPEAARGTGTSARITVGFVVDETGSVLNPTIESSDVRGNAPSSLFHEEALAAARQIRYQPARERGKPVRSWTTVTYTFEVPGS